MHACINTLIHYCMRVCHKGIHMLLHTMIIRYFCTITILTTIFLMSHSYRFAFIHDIPIECNSTSLLQSGNSSRYQESLCSQSPQIHHMLQGNYPTAYTILRRRYFAAVRHTFGPTQASYATIQVYLSAVRYSHITTRGSTTQSTHKNT